MQIKRLIALCLTALMILTSCGSGESSERAETEGTTASTVTTTTTSAGKSVTGSTATTTSETATETTTTTEETTATTSETTAATTTTTTTHVTTTTTTATTPKPTATTTKASATAPTVTAKAAVVYCPGSGEVLFGKELDRRVSLASITKLLTASVALKYMSPDTVITVGTELSMVHPGSSLALLAKGMKMPLGDLLYGLLLPSGNDAAYTLAVNTARAVYPEKQLSDKEALSLFLGLMNDFAQELGMTSSHFATPEGWDDPQHYTTVADMMKLMNYVLGVDTIRTVVSTYTKTVYFETGGYAAWASTNLLLNPSSAFYDSTAIGLKTGTTDDAGCCIAAAFRRNGKIYVCIVMGCSSKYELFVQLKQLTDHYLK